MFGVRILLSVKKVLMNNDLAMQPVTNSQQSFFMSHFFSISISGQDSLRPQSGPISHPLKYQVLIGNFVIF